ncbi:MAG: transcription termination/antitermination protein NusG [Candidatus Binatia bacterium]
MEPGSLEIEAELRWYAIQTKPRKETVVEKRLGVLNLEVFLPWLRSRCRIGTRYQWVLVPLFPGYLFSRLDLVRSGKDVRYAPGVKDFVKFGNHIGEVGVEVIQALQDRCPDGVARVQPSYRPGERIIIREGPLSGLEAIFEEEIRGSRRVAILLDLLSRTTRVVLSSEMIARS